MDAEEKVRAVLRSVSDEALATCDAFASEYQKRFAREVVLRRLLPLLLAGQAMRDCNYINNRNSMAWDAALAAAEKAST